MSHYSDNEDADTMPASVIAVSNNDQDLDLASRCAAGEQGAQKQLFDEHKGRVHSTLYRILGSNRDMEDLIQESFLQVFRSIASYRGDARLATWISRISARVAYTYLSRRKLPVVTLESVPDAPAGDPDAERQAIAREAARRLYGVLDRIDAKQRIAFALHVIDGCPLREVAEITDATVVAVKTRVWRARKEVARRAKNDPLLAQYLNSRSES